MTDPTMEPAAHSSGRLSSLGRPAWIGLAAIAVHLLVHLAHGLVHELVPVRIAAWQTAVVALVVFAAPVGAAYGLLSGRRALAAGALVTAGLGSLAFEVPFHFLLSNPDHVHAVAAGSNAFATTAVLGALTDVFLVAVGAWLVVTPHRSE